jgi:hypothetical protein
MPCRSPTRVWRIGSRILRVVLNHGEPTRVLGGTARGEVGLGRWLGSAGPAGSRPSRLVSIAMYHSPGVGLESGPEAYAKQRCADPRPMLEVANHRGLDEIDVPSSGGCADSPRAALMIARGGLEPGTSRFQARGAPCIATEKPWESMVSACGPGARAAAVRSELGVIWATDSRTWLIGMELGETFCSACPGTGPTPLISGAGAGSRGGASHGEGERCRDRALAGDSSRGSRGLDGVGADAARRWRWPQSGTAWENGPMPQDMETSGRGARTCSLSGRRNQHLP